MSASDKQTWFDNLINGIKRAFAQFLGVPLAIIAGFLILMAITLWLDAARLAWLESVRSFLTSWIFADAEATKTLLGVVVASTITIASVTFSILLLAVQQAAAYLTSSVLDQFLERRLNQVFFGYFVALAVYALIVLSTVQQDFNPIISAGIILILTILALIFLIVLIYSSISQMRPMIVTNSIMDNARQARDTQLKLLAQTRRTSELETDTCTLIRANRSGFVTGINLKCIQKAFPERTSEIEIVIRTPVGTYVADQDTIAEIRTAADDDTSDLADAVRRAILLDRIRDFDRDPAYAVDQLVNITWTDYSSSKQIPVTGDSALLVLRDLLGTWGAEEEQKDRHEPSIPVVYPDNLVDYTIDALLDMGISSSEGMQSRSFAKVVRAYAMVFPRLPVKYRQRVSDNVLRLLSGLGDLILTQELSEALLFLADVLTETGWQGTAEAVLSARADLATTIGKLNSRSTRASGSSG